jgi:hypothetical protein
MAFRNAEQNVRSPPNAPRFICASARAAKSRATCPCRPSAI